MKTIKKLHYMVALSLASLIGCDKKDEYPIKGELIKDVIMKSENSGQVYRVVGLNYEPSGTGRIPFVYSIIGSPEELTRLERELVSREERLEREGSDVKGDSIEINPNSNISSLDGVLLLPKDIRKVQKNDKD